VKWGRSCEFFLLRGGETAARHPLLGLDPRIPFSYQEKARGNQKCKENSSDGVGGAQGEEGMNWGRSCEFFLLRGGETAARHPLLDLDPGIPFSYQEKARGNQKCKEYSK